VTNNHCQTKQNNDVFPELQYRHVLAIKIQESLYPMELRSLENIDLQGKAVPLQAMEALGGER
jgi:hypothetical protein